MNRREHIARFARIYGVLPFAAGAAMIAVMTAIMVVVLRFLGQT